MIISPPFLPAVAANQNDEAWVDAAMPSPRSRLADTGAPEGSFPLSHNLMWHNGVHIQAPVGNGASLPARAVADGTVVFVSAPATPNSTVTDPQNYNPFDRPGTQTAAWTDNGCAIIEHRTSIGAEGAAETEVVFYSLYMHLSALGKITPPGQARRDLAVGDAIWRKDEVGTPGQVYGNAGQIHFEICCDAANLQRLIGRAPDWVEPAIAPATLPAPAADGRTDSIFGSLFFHLPANTPTDAGVGLPASHLRRAGGTTLGTPVWLKMTFASGDCTFETFDERGGLIADSARTDQDAEYNLFREATDRHNALPAASQAQSSPSGWYELLRFGRNVGRGTAAADKDALPANAAHWRRIVAADGHTVWADLNAQGSFKFSDADFLPVMGWNCVDDDTRPNDQRCDSARLKNLIRDPDPANTRRMEVSELSRRLGNDGVRSKLRRAVCKFPSEWDKGSITPRYAFVKDLEPFKQSPQAWPRLEAHLKAVSFDGLPAAYLAADWRVHPQEFIGYMRKCGWLSAAEMPQVVIRRNRLRPRIPITWAQASARIARHRSQLNQTFRKFCFEARLRQAHFFGQCVQETDYLQAMSEYIAFDADYAPYFGRGFTQLTWAKNYVSYGKFRGFPAPTTFTAANFPAWFARFRGNWYDGRPSAEQLRQQGRPHFVLDGKVVPSWDVELVATDNFIAVDTGGFYWVWKELADSSSGRRTGQKNILRLADAGFLQADVDEVTYNINGGWNGRDIRRLTGPYAWSVLNDEPLHGDFERQIP